MRLIGVIYKENCWAFFLKEKFDESCVPFGWERRAVHLIDNEIRADFAGVWEVRGDELCTKIAVQL